MLNNIRLVAAGIIAFMVVAVDFTSKILSIVSDGMLVIGLIIVLLPIIKQGIKDKEPH